MTQEELERAAEAALLVEYPSIAKDAARFNSDGYTAEQVCVAYRHGYLARATEGIATEDAIEAIHELGEDDFRAAIAELTRRRPGQDDRAKRGAELVAKARSLVEDVVLPETGVSIQLQTCQDLNGVIDELAALLESTE